MIGIFLDTETNGLDFHSNRIIEIAFKLIDLFNGDVIAEYNTIVSQPLKVWEMSDPASLEVNGFTWEMLKDGISEEQLRSDIKEIFKKHNIRRREAVYICQNPSFDRNFFCQIISSREQEKLQWPYHWLDFASMFWSLTIEGHRTSQGPLPWDVGFSKDKIAKHLGLPPEQSPHRAMNGVDHLIQCYTAAVGYLAPSD